MPRVALRGLTKRYQGRTVVDDVTIDVGEGELLVLVGPSGCGKTTTLRLIAGLEETDAGTITIGDRDVTKLPPARRNVAMVFQSYALFPHMNAFDNLAFGLTDRGIPSGEVSLRVKAVAERLGIEALLPRRPSQLSGGERQRVALGRAMLREPDLFLMDEPLSNLDAPLRTQTRIEIAALQERLGTTTIYVTHDQTEALALGTRMGVMHEGVLEQIGDPHEVYDAPATLRVARFIGSPPMNLFDARVDGDAIAWTGGRLRRPHDLNQAPQIVVGARAEHVHIQGSRWSGAPPSTGRFAARVERIEPLGDQSILVLDASGTTLLARVEPALRPARGTVLTAWLDRLHVFDAASGRRL